MTINHSESHIQSRVWFALSDESQAPSWMGTLKSVLMDLRASWPPFKEWCHQAESRPWRGLWGEPTHTGSYLKAYIPQLSISFLPRRSEVGFWNYPSQRHALLTFSLKRQKKMSIDVVFITRNEAFKWTGELCGTTSYLPFLEKKKSHLCEIHLWVWLSHSWTCRSCAKVTFQSGKLLGGTMLAWCS